MQGASKKEGGFCQCDLWGLRLLYHTFEVSGSNSNASKAIWQRIKDRVKAGLSLPLLEKRKHVSAFTIANTKELSMNCPHLSTVELCDEEALVDESLADGYFRILEELALEYYTWSDNSIPLLAVEKLFEITKICRMRDREMFLADLAVDDVGGLAGEEVVRNLDSKMHSAQLAKIAKEAKNVLVREAAVAKYDFVRHPELLRHLAMEGENVKIRKTAVWKLRPGLYNGHAEAAMQVANKERESFLVTNAAYHILRSRVRHGLVLQVIVGDDSEWVRFSELCQLDPAIYADLLLELAQVDECPMIRRAALEHFDPNCYEAIRTRSILGVSEEALEGTARYCLEMHAGTLAQIVLEDEDPAVRHAASKMLGHEIYAEFSKQESSSSRVSSPLTSEKSCIVDVLDFSLSVALSDQSPSYLQQAALKKLEELRCFDALVSVVEHDKNDYARAEALRRLDIESCYDLIVRIASGEQSSHVRKEAVEKLDKVKHSDLLAQIAKSDESWSVREIAVHKLDAVKHVDLLTYIAKKDAHFQVRVIAQRKLSKV